MCINRLLRGCAFTTSENGSLVRVTVLRFIGEMRAETQFESSTGNTTIWIFEA